MSSICDESVNDLAVITKDMCSMLPRYRECGGGSDQRGAAVAKTAEQLGSLPPTYYPTLHILVGYISV
jgi:hypothetical protein